MSLYASLSAMISSRLKLQRRLSVALWWQNEPLAASLLTILVTEWVLRSRYRFDKEVVVRTFKMLLEAGDVLIEGEDTQEQALYLFEDSSADFADCLMVARYQRMGFATMLTFDENAAKLAGCELLA